MKSLICVFSNQERILIPDGVEVINTFAFYGLKNLRCVELPKSVDEMRCSFVMCPNLERVIYNSLIMKEDQNNYYGCDRFEGIDVPKEAAQFYLLSHSEVFVH